jgi:hypothetical protein
MKKLYSKMLLILFLGLTGISAYAQGTWKAIGTETTINPSTAIALGITNLTSMHSDAGTNYVVGKTDVGAPTVSYNGVDWNNEAFIQGVTNGMYYAFLPSVSGTLDIATKIGSAKKAFILEITDACWTSLSTTSGDLAKLTNSYSNGTNFTTTPAYFTTPSVYDTYHLTTGTWDGSTNFQESGANAYPVMSFAVTANKTYVVGVFGSKFMLRGVNLSIPTRIVDNETPEEMKIFPNPAKGNVYLKTNELTSVSIYNSSGILVKQQKASPSLNNIDVSGLNPGVYYVKAANDKKAQKLIVK